MSAEARPTAAELARAIAGGKERAIDVIDAHIARIRAVNPDLNAVVFERFADARREAAEADRRVRAGGSLPPLLGVPITIKESIDLEGSPSTFGIDGRTVLAKKDAPAVARLREAGAIVLAKTNVAQHLMFFETDNPVFGRTNHPMSKDRSCGGSSGGEAALISAGASPLGIGTDLGGSARNPAALCGLVGFKPTAGRLVDEGTGSAPTGQELVVSQVGALARSVDDVALALGVAMSDGDDGRGPLGAAEVDFAKLRVVAIEDDGVFAACPAARRAVREARDRLLAMGARAVDLPLPDRHRAHAAFVAAMSADGAAQMRAVVGKSRVDPRIRQLIDTSTKPRPIVNLLLALTGRKANRAVVDAFADGTAGSYFRLVDEVRAMRRAALAAVRGGDVVVITPPCPIPAYRHGACLELGTLGSYTTYWNVLGWPAGVVPWTKVRAGEESDRPASKDPCVVAAREAERDSVGLPIGVQVAAPPHRDHVALAVMRALASS